MSSNSGSFSGSSSSACSSRSDCENSFDVEELLEIGARRRELRKVKDMLRESQPRSIELVRRLELQSKSLSESRLEDTARIQKMEKELLNCYKEIDYLRDQLIFRSKEVNYLNDHVHDLEFKLTESKNLEEEVNCLREDLCMSKSEHLLLLQELESKDSELQSSSLSIEKLKETISSLTLESLCEIESMKLDISKLEQELVDAMQIQEESIQENDQLRGIIKEFQFQSQRTQENVKYLEKQNEELRDSEKSMKYFFQSTKERLESEDEQPLNAGCFFEGMVKQIQQHEDVVMQLKDELKKEKLKAKEESEDLTQEMAELRYKMTCLLDEERNRRVCIEQASLHRIAKLEAQIKRETQTRTGL